jgi:radical SAM superfamily enzyme YgiQ (UPF0313 family)
MYKAILFHVSAWFNDYLTILPTGALKAYAQKNETIRKNWEIKTIFCENIPPVSKKEFISKWTANLIAEAPALIGFSCYQWNISLFSEMIPILAKALPQTKIVLGGPQICLQWIQQGRYDSLPVNYLAAGEGEKIFAGLLLYLIGGKPAREDILGLAFRDQYSERFSNISLQITSEDYSDFPSPYQQGLVDDEVYSRASFSGLIESQRGCSFKCAYCIFHKVTGGRGIRYRTPDEVMKDIRFLDSKGCHKVTMADANFGSNLTYAKEILRKIIESDLKLWCFYFTTSPTFIDEELSSLYGEFIKKRDGNAVIVNVGLQTTNLETLKIMRRPHNLKQVVDHVRLLLKNGVFIKFDTIIGLPNDTAKDVERTIDFCIDLFSESDSHTFQPHILEILPGSDLEPMQTQYGLTTRVPLYGNDTYESPQVYETKTIPRAEFVHALRQTAVIYRILNGRGWAKWKTFNKPEKTHGPSTMELRDAFFTAREKLNISNIALIELIGKKLQNQLPRHSLFLQNDFPYADIWWMLKGYNEVKDEWFLSACKDLALTAK